jgi:hypothetical protein
MTSEEFLALRFSFFKVVNIQLTKRCPLKCRHCAVDAPAGMLAAADPVHLRRWVAGVSKAGPVEWLSVSGGEPFAAMTELAALLEAATEHGLSTQVATSGYWAGSARAARDTLLNIPAISFLIVSTDEFHEEFVPLPTVVRAIEAGLALAGHVGVQITIGPDHDAFMKRLHDRMGAEFLRQVDIIEVPLRWSGRARSTGVAQAPARDTRLPEGYCLMLGAPVIREDGALVACCHSEVVQGREQTALCLGNLKERTLAAYMARVDSDVYLQTLRVYGPQAIAREATGQNWRWRPRRYEAENICDLCRDLAANPQVIEGFRSLHDTPQYRRELALMRLVRYGETQPLEAIKQSGIPRTLRRDLAFEATRPGRTV